MTHIPDKVLADLRLLKGTFSADAVSCNGRGISIFEGGSGNLFGFNAFSRSLEKMHWKHLL